MRFELDETTEAVVQAAAAALPAEETDVERSWKALGHSGLLSLSVPARLGGEGLGVLPSMTVLTFGRAGRDGGRAPG